MLEDIDHLKTPDGDFSVMKLARFLAESPSSPRKLTQSQRDLADHMASFSESAYWITGAELRLVWTSKDGQGLSELEVDALLGALPQVVKIDQRGRYSVADLAVLFAE